MQVFEFVSLKIDLGQIFLAVAIRLRENVVRDEADSVERKIERFEISRLAENSRAEILDFVVAGFEIDQVVLVPQQIPVDMSQIVVADVEPLKIVKNRDAKPPALSPPMV